MSTLSIKLNSSLKKNKSNINSLIKNSNQSSNSHSNSNQFISYNVNINPIPLGEGSFKKCFHLLDKNNNISEKYILCIYIPKTQNHINRKEEIIQKELSKECPKYVTKLYDYGSIDDSSEIKKKFENSNNKTFHYCLFEKGLYDLEVIINNIKEIFKKNIVNKQIKKDLFKFYIDILIKIVYSIECIHINGYLHLDIKPENILVFESDNNNNGDYIEIKDNLKKILNIQKKYIKIKFTDFGFSIEKNKSNRKTRGTYEYINKSLFLSKNKTYDIYSDLYSISKMYEELIINGNLHNQTKGKSIFQNINKNINKLFSKLNLNKLNIFKELSKNIVVNQKNKKIIETKFINNNSNTPNKIYKFEGNKVILKKPTFTIPALSNKTIIPYELLINILEKIKVIFSNFNN